MLQLYKCQTFWPEHFAYDWVLQAYR
jgi:hypothetical protein